MAALQHTIQVEGMTARVTCTGRIAAGNEAEELDAALQQLLKEAGTIELDLGGVTFLDSSGIGVLVRNLLRARQQRKVLRLTALSPQVRHTLEITSLLGQFRSATPPVGVRRGLRVLFVHPAPEVRTFAGALLTARGAQVNTCASLYDARLLAAAGETDVLVLPANIDLTQPAGGLTVVRLEPEFFAASGDEAGEALVARINAAIA